MTPSTFFLMLALVYVFYYVIVIAFDTLPSKKHRAAAAVGKQDFVVSGSTLQQPVTVKVEEDLSTYMPQIETGEDNEPENEGEKDDQEDSLQSAMRFETYSDEERFVQEVDEEELKWMIA